jgi:hypothetical protein
LIYFKIGIELENLTPGYMKSDSLMVMKILMLVFWTVMPRGLVERYHCPGGTY